MKFLLSLLILFLSILLEHTFLPKNFLPFIYLNISTLTFLSILLYLPHTFFWTTIFIGLFKDTLNYSPLGTHILTFFILAFFIKNLSKFILKDNLFVKLLYALVATVIVSLIPQIVEEYSNIALEIIFKKIIVNSIFFPLWAKILSGIIK